MMTSFSTSAGTTDWLTALAMQSKSNYQSVLITVLQTKGSTPRETGAKMLVTPAGCVGTIGGGHLEFKVIELGQSLLAETHGLNEPQFSSHIHRIPLGASLGQCCGGHVEVLLERLSHTDLSWALAAVELLNKNEATIIVTQLDSLSAKERYQRTDKKLVVSQASVAGSLGSPNGDADAMARARLLLNSPDQGPVWRIDHLLFESLTPQVPEVLLFGAGHVGRAMVRVLQHLPCRIQWIDSRQVMLTDVSTTSNLRVFASDDPASCIDQAPAGCYVLIMTHSHQLDMELCEHALKRSDLAFCGLIGSATKRQRFLRRLSARGFNKEQLDRLTCPIGVKGISGKEPAQIAVATAAQLLQHFEDPTARSRDTVVMSVTA